jgi:putative membrane protein
VSAQFLDEAARAAFGRAVEAIEGVSAVEVVISFRQRSSRYLHANVIVGAAIAFAGLATMLFAQASFGLLSILFDPFILGLLVGAAVELTPAIKRVLTPHKLRHFHVTRGARSAFVERGVHNTTGRSGLLVYLSWLEQDVALVPDGGLAASLDAAELTKMEDQLTAAMGEGGAAVAKVLEGLATRFHQAMPRAEGDVNELPDAIDEAKS